MFDQTKPVISAINFSDDNSYVDVEFSVEVFSNSNGSGALELTDFQLSFNQNNGTATSATLTSIRKTDSKNLSTASALVGGESQVRIFISINGTPNGLESISIAPTNGSSIFDLAGNGAEATQAVSSATIKDKTLPTLSFNPQNESKNVARSSNMVITASESIRKVVPSHFGNYEINDQNIDTLITLSYDNPNGAPIAFDAKISADKKIITVDPVLNFKFGSTIFISLTGFEDFGGNLPSQSTSASFDVIENVKPVAIAQNVELNEDDSLSIVLSGSDSENFSLSFSYSLPKHGVFYGNVPNLTYKPIKNYFGNDSLRFVVSDGFDNSDSATVQIRILAVNDRPQLSIPSYDTLKISQVHYEGYVFPQILNSNNSILKPIVNDVDDKFIVKTIVTVDPYFIGEDTLFIESTDVQPNIAIDNGIAVYTFDTMDSIGDNSPYAISKIKYENLKGKELTKGVRNITIQISDGKMLSNEETRFVDVNIINSPPKALSENVSTNEDTALSFTLKATDSDFDSLTYTIISGPYGGKIYGILPNIRYIPKDNFHGADSLKFKVYDGIQMSKNAVINIHVKSVNDPPSHLAPTLPDDKAEIVVTINNIDNTNLNFSWLKSVDLDGDKLSYLFSAWYEIIGESGNLKVINIDTSLSSTNFSITYMNLINALNDYKSPRGNLIWTVNVTDDVDTTFSNIRYSVLIEGKYVALSIEDGFIPKEFKLSQNYPNPFNPKTRIQFDIPRISYTTVVVYDLLGNQVATLINKKVVPGRHVLTWNAVDDFNKKLPSGIYFYQIQADRFVDTKKMLLLK